jgi:hypothetical protein
VSSGATDQPFVSLLAVRRAESSPATVRVMALSDEDLLLRIEAGDRASSGLSDNHRRPAGLPVLDCF